MKEASYPCTHDFEEVLPRLRGARYIVLSTDEFDDRSELFYKVFEYAARGSHVRYVGVVLERGCYEAVQGWRTSLAGDL